MIFFRNFFKGGGRKIQVCPRAPDTLATPLRNHMDGRTACPHSSLRQIVGKGEEWGELLPQSIPGGLGLARSWGRDPLLSKHCCEHHTAMF